MQIVKTNLILLCNEKKTPEKWGLFDPIWAHDTLFHFDQLCTDILLVDALCLTTKNDIENIKRAKEKKHIKKIILTYDDDTTDIPVAVINSLQPRLIKKSADLVESDFYNIWDSIQLAEQNSTYLSLSSELNFAYEDLKNELELKLNDKTKNLIESRRKVFEINSRVEFLRRALYTISEIKSLSTAEEKLSSLLTSYNKVTWFKVIPESEKTHFERDIHSQFDSTLLKTEILLQEKKYFLYFFKGDKKLFKRTDIHLFKKMSETLQINLSRIYNLRILQKNENFFNLAFQSSNSPIVVINQNYEVIQANKSAHLNGNAASAQHCYELLFNRTMKCHNCQLGSQFEIQNKNTFYNVHSQPLNLMEQEDNRYWVHVYEDTTEQNLYEKKISQLARLEELGLISSSIAHELNNPLGGILSYLQIMKMELPLQHALISDLDLMHQAGLRIKKIVEDLLIFSRTNQQLIFENADLEKITHDILIQLELQLKVEKIKVSFVPTAEKISCLLSKKLFQDALHLIMLFFIEKAKSKRSDKQSFVSIVEVKISQDLAYFYLTFSANAGMIQDELKTKDLNILAIEKNITDQGFQLFITEPTKGWIQFSILLPKDKQINLKS